jgi:hypothetical protein
MISGNAPEAFELRLPFGAHVSLNATQFQVSFHTADPMDKPKLSLQFERNSDRTHSPDNFSSDLPCLVVAAHRIRLHERSRYS